jgi:hypothetical protein
MTSERGAVYPIGLLRDVARWSVPVGLAVALLGGAGLRDVRFGVSCLVGAAADIAMLRWALRRAKDFDVEPAQATGPLLLLFVARLSVKAALLVVAALLPRWLSLLGMAIGVLVVDFTLATAGSASAVRRTLRPHRSGG